MPIQKGMQHSVETTNLADLLERLLDKGIVIAGDIKVKIVDIELLTIQIRLVICSVDKAREMGMDWWVSNPAFSAPKAPAELSEGVLSRIEERLNRIEDSLAPAREAVPLPIPLSAPSGS